MGCRRSDADHPDPRGYAVPAESTYQRALAATDHHRFDPLLLLWQRAPRGPGPEDLIALDGKRRRRSGGLALASAVGQPSQRVHATVTLGPPDSEIVAVRQLLAQTEFPDQLLALDALPTPQETLPQIRCDHGADYLVPLKDNPPTILATAKALLPESCSPSGGWVPPTCRVSGRCEQRGGTQIERWIIVRDVTPAPLGLAGAAPLAMILRPVTENGTTTTTRNYFVPSRPAERLDPTPFLLLRRRQWGIESICHQRLDVSLHEDQSRVRSLSGVAVLGVLSRISLALFQADCQRPRPRLDWLLERCLPP